MSSYDLKTKTYRVAKDIDVSSLLFLWSVDLLRRRTAEILRKSIVIEDEGQSLKPLRFWQ
jgi:hypothetical protein